MEITGRVTGDAVVRTTKDSKEVVAFTIVDNHRYTTKAGEKKEIATFFNCDYWGSTKVAAVLKKGTIVTLSGMVGINSYENSEGKFIAQLTFHTNAIKIIANGKEKATTPADTAAVPTTTPKKTYPINHSATNF